MMVLKYFLCCINNVSYESLLLLGGLFENFQTFAKPKHIFAKAKHNLVKHNKLNIIKSTYIYDVN